MLVLKAILLFLTVLFVSYRVGLIINKIFKSNNYCNILLYGFITIITILQIIYIPLMLIHTSFNIVLYITIILTLGIVAVSFKLCKWKDERILFIQNKTKIKAMKKKNIIITMILIMILIVQASIASLLFNENADDAFYVSLVEQNKNSQSIYRIDPSLGIENDKILTNYMISGYELSLSVISKIFIIPSTILCHTIIPFIMILLSYMAYYVLARKFFSNEKAQIFIIFLAILFLFSGFTTRLRGIILLGRMWQGKEIFLNIVLTLILSNLISINKYNENKNLIALALLNFSAVFFTNTAIFLVPFAYMAFGIIELLKRNYKTFGKLIVSGIPIVVYAMIFLILTKSGDSAYTEIKLIDVIKDYMGTGYYYILYIISLVFILIKGNKRAKRYFILVPLIYILTIYNPLFIGIITKYFTNSSVYWRLFWLLPMEFSICYAFVLMLDLNKNKMYKLSISIIEILLLILMGHFVFTKENGFEIAENLQKIPQNIIDQTQYILDNQKEGIATVMALPEPLHNTTMRQLTSKINLFWSRDMYMNDMFSQEQLSEMLKIYSVCQGAVPRN